MKYQCTECDKVSDKLRDLNCHYGVAGVLDIPETFEEFLLLAELSAFFTFVGENW